MSANKGIPVFTNFDDFYAWISKKYPGLDKQKLIKAFSEKGILFEENGKVKLVRKEDIN